MAPRSKNAPPMAHYMEKEPSAVHQRNAQWIEEQTGYTPDLKTIQICISTYQQFQRSDFNKAANAAAREARAAASAERKARAEERKSNAETRKAEREQRAADRAAKKAAAPARKAAAKKAPAKKAAAKKAPAKTAKPRPRKRTAASTAEF